MAYSLSWKATVVTRVRCKKCNNIFEITTSSFILSVHLGPYHWMKCPACGKNGFFNVYSSVKEPISWLPEAVKKEQEPEKEQLSEEELEKKRIEDSKYERAQRLLSHFQYACEFWGKKFLSWGLCKFECQKQLFMLQKKRERKLGQQPPFSGCECRLCFGSLQSGELVLCKCKREDTCAQANPKQD